MYRLKKIKTYLIPKAGEYVNSTFGIQLNCPKKYNSLKLWKNKFINPAI
jgi:hypothetical protein